MSNATIRLAATGRAWARLAAVFALLGLSGCASTGAAPEEPSAGEAQATPPAAMLLAEARAAITAGDYDRAAAFVERAMRIDPRNPTLYLELAGVRLGQGRPAQAENVAMRAMTLAPGDRAVASAAWSVIAGARERRGDTAGAAEARQAAGPLE